MNSYIKLFSILALGFYILAVMKYPVRMIFPKTGLYRFFRSAHRPFAAAAWICMTIHGVLVINDGRYSFLALALFVSLTLLLILGAYNKYAKPVIKKKIISYHRISAVFTALLIIAHYFEMNGILI